jgi:uncharacterized protein YecE (DUF72 family)
MDSSAPLYLGCAGWNLLREHWPLFPTEGSHLQRYAGRLNAVEINSSFYRPHQPATYRKWAQSVPAWFRFCVKMPKHISHERRLVDCAEVLDAFLAQCTQLEGKLGCLLLQLPPSLKYQPEQAAAFFALLRSRYQGPVALEPRHVTWLQADALLQTHRVAQVAADPSPLAEGLQPAGWAGLRYYRLHGSPVIYRSAYGQTFIEQLAQRLRGEPRPAWCIFDNTASGAAVADAQQLQASLKWQ